MANQLPMYMSTLLENNIMVFVSYLEINDTSKNFIMIRDIDIHVNWKIMAYVLIIIIIC